MNYESKIELEEKAFNDIEKILDRNEEFFTISMTEKTVTFEKDNLRYHLEEVFINDEKRYTGLKIFLPSNSSKKPDAEFEKRPKENCSDYGELHIRGEDLYNKQNPQKHT